MLNRMCFCSECLLCLASACASGRRTEGCDSMIDSHIHLSSRSYNQTFPFLDTGENGMVIRTGTRSEMIQAVKQRGVTCCIEPAIHVDGIDNLLELSREYEGWIYPAIGNHPTRCIQSPLKDFQRVKDYSRHQRIVAIGETGLDYHYERKKQHRFRQKIWFRWQINLAHQLRLPLILHIRMAHEDAVKILRRNRHKLHGGVCHCFNGGAETAKIYTDELGLCLGIGGSLLLRPEISGPLQQAVIATPLEYLLLETDGPYVKPEKMDGISGKKWMKVRNSSLILPDVAQRIAELKNLTAEEVIRVTEDNTRKLFHIPG